LDEIQEAIEARPQCRLVLGVEGLLTDCGMAVETDRMVIHPLAFLEMIKHYQDREKLFNDTGRERFR